MRTKEPLVATSSKGAPPEQELTASWLGGKLWPLGAPRSSGEITLATRVRDRFVRLVSDQWRGFHSGQFAPLPGCYRQLANGRTIVYIHINKTGGTSIARALGITYKTHLTVQQAQQRIPRRLWDRAYKLAIVRNPWDKVVSHYEFRVRTNQTQLARHRVSFGDWVRLAYGEQKQPWYDNPKMFQSQTEWLSSRDGVLAMDYVGRFESLQESFDTVMGELGIAAELPHLNRTVRRDYRDYYDAESQAIVADRFGEDCRRFGYRFE